MATSSSISRSRTTPEPGRSPIARSSTVAASHAVSSRTDGQGHTSPNLRLVQRVAVRPHTAYRFSCWVKTRDLAPTGSFRLLVLATSQEDARSRSTRAGSRRPQDWKKIDVVFNSLDEREVTCTSASGAREKGPLARRPGPRRACPRQPPETQGLPVRRQVGGRQDIYEEGQDFEPVADASSARFPGRANTVRPCRCRSSASPPRSRIRDGDRLRVSWYHPIITHGSQVMCCLSEPKV